MAEYPPPHLVEVSVVTGQLSFARCRIVILGYETNTRSALLDDLEFQFTATEEEMGVREATFTSFASPTGSAWPTTRSSIPVRTRSQTRCPLNEVLDSQRAKPRGQVKLPSRRSEKRVGIRHNT
jgi:hypothetical protein